MPSGTGLDAMQSDVHAVVNRALNPSDGPANMIEHSIAVQRPVAYEYPL
jgi:hypothetical protein